MAIKFPQLIYFLDYQTKNLLLRFRLLPVNNSLLLETTVNQLYNDPANINLKQTFFTNPDAEDVFDRTNKQLLGSYSSGYNEIISFKIYVNNIPTTNNLNQLDLVLGTSKLKLHLEAFQLEGLKTFINSVANNYIGYQIDLLKLALEEPILVVKEEEPIKEEVKEEIEAPSFEENPIIDLLALSPNNLTTYYLTRFLVSQSSIIEYDGKILKVPLCLNSLYSEAYQLTLYNLVSNISLSKEEIGFRLKSLFTNLNNILSNDYNEKIAEIHIILFLAYLYMLKSMVELSVINFRIHISRTYFNALNKWLNICKKIFESSSELMIEELKIDNNKTSPLYLKNLELLIKQHQYLINIDKNLFLKHIIQNLEAPIPNNKKNINLKVGLTNPKLLDIDQVLSLPPVKTNTRINFINYTLQNNTITHDYFLLIDIFENSNINQIEKLNPVVKLHMDTIIKKIFNKIDSNISNQSIVKTNLSTLYLLENFISPFIEESLESQLFILYQILIPHLYTKYKVSKYIDYFV